MRAARRMGLAAPRLPLVVGGAGEVGRHMLAALADAGCSGVRVLDAKPPEVSPEGLAVDFRQHRLGRDKAGALDSILDGVDCVFNLAAADARVATEAEMRRTNVKGVKELLERSRAAGVTKFVHATSAFAVTGHDRPAQQQTEEEPLPTSEEYTSPHDRTHREGEEAVLAACDGEEFATVSLRAGNLLASPWDPTLAPMLVSPGSVISLEETALVDFMAASDFCSAALKAVDRLESPAVAGQSIFVTKGTAVRTHDAAQLLAEMLGWNCVLLPPFAQTCIGFGMRMRRQAWSTLGQSVTGAAEQDLLRAALVEKTFDNSRAQYTLDFESSASLEEALEQVVRLYREKHPKPGS